MGNNKLSICVGLSSNQICLEKNQMKTKLYMHEPTQEVKSMDDWEADAEAAGYDSYDVWNLDLIEVEPDGN